MGKKSVKPKRGRPDTKILNDRELTPHENLALSIVGTAVADAKRLRANKAPKSTKVVDQFELLNFFRSRWCAILLGTTEITGEDIMDKVGLKDVFNSR
jgi:hypothetical protein